MTENEAKAKWCPFVRYTSSRGEGINRWSVDGDTQLTPTLSMCIGSACMAWRLGKPEYRNESRGPEGGYHKGLIVDGYCGLAGQPQ